jgi:hypothetical protein
MNLYLKMYLRIQNPETGEHINLYNDEVNQLLYKYTEKELLACQIQPEKYNRNTLFTNDLLYQYMLYSEVKDIKNLCCIDKAANQLCNSYFWTNKILIDKLPIFKKDNDSREYQYIKNIALKVERLKKYDRINLKEFRHDLSFIRNNKFNKWYINNKDKSSIQNITINLKYNYITISIYTDNDFNTIDNTLTHNQLLDILTEILYRQPDIV